MGCVFSTLTVHEILEEVTLSLTVDAILEEVFCQYTHTNFNSTPIVELIFEFAVTINGFYCYKKWDKRILGYGCKLICFNQESHERQKVRIMTYDDSVLGNMRHDIRDEFDWEFVKFINFNQIQLNVNGDIVQIFLKSKLIFEKDKIYKYTEKNPGGNRCAM
jgi:hypothetical protein